MARLADAYGQDTFLDAATRVQQARRFDATAVRRLLEHDYGPLPEQSALPLGGSGADIVGDFEQDGLESFGHLDTQQSNTPTTTNERRDKNGSFSPSIPSNR